MSGVTGGPGGGRGGAVGRGAEAERSRPPAVRRVVLASADAERRARLRASLGGLRWEVKEAAGAAAALALLEEAVAEAIVLDDWLPDLEVGEFEGSLGRMYPGLEVLRMDGAVVETGSRSPRREELQHALRQAELGEGRGPVDFEAATRPVPETAAEIPLRQMEPAAVAEERVALLPAAAAWRGTKTRSAAEVRIEGLVGESAAMLELAALVRMVAPSLATVLIEGETGTGKEVVAQALHRLSPRAAKPLVVLNCAAIPESLLEAELFGHTRGAFTGAVQARMGRIEAAHGGTLFLDEIGEMPLGLQAKLLRFLEAHELQRVGENEVVRVNVRVIAATHQRLEQRVREGAFRLDLYHRLAVFPLEVPPLRERKQDIPALAEHHLAEMGRSGPRKRLSAGALERLMEHDWPGNVRELGHVLERAAILAGAEPVLQAEQIRLRRVTQAFGGDERRG